MPPKEAEKKRIAFITDLHTGQPDERPFGIDLRDNFTKLLTSIRALEPDLLVLGGDLCLMEGSVQVYQWQKAHLDSLHIPYHLLAGNHDDPIMMSDVFELSPMSSGELYYTLKLGSHELIMLDTSQARLSGDQKRWLRDKLAKKEMDMQVIFMHHPPDLMQVPHMDRQHYLKDKEEVMQLLRSVNHNLQIFCGHYHVEKTVAIGQIQVHITPSCYFQIDAEKEEFAIDHKDIALRIIDLYEDRIDLTVRYLR